MNITYPEYLFRNFLVCYGFPLSDWNAKNQAHFRLTFWQEVWYLTQPCRLQGCVFKSWTLILSEEYSATQQLFGGLSRNVMLWSKVYWWPWVTSFFFFPGMFPFLRKSRAARLTYNILIQLIKWEWIKPFQAILFEVSALFSASHEVPTPVGVCLR